jgi:hypothetical protein
LGVTFWSQPGVHPGATDEVGGAIEDKLASGLVSPSVPTVPIDIIEYFWLVDSQHRLAAEHKHRVTLD